MKKPIIAIAVIILAIVLFSFANFETSVDIPKTGDTGEAGDYISSDGALVTVVEVTDKAGEVVATEKVTFSKDEVEFGQDFFAKPDTETTVPNGILPDRLQAVVSQASTENNSADTTATTVPSVTSGKDNTTRPSSTTTTTAKPSKPSKPTNQTTTTKPSQNTTTTNPPVTEKTELDIMRSQKYYFTGRIVDANGNVSTYKIARDGTKYSAVAMYSDEEIGIIVNDTDILMVSVSEKTYISIPISMIQNQAGSEEMIEGLLSGEAYNMRKNKVAEYTANEDGVQYVVIEYDDGTKDYMYGTLLIKTVASDNSVLYYDMVTDEFPSSVFLPPVGYTKQELTDVGVSEFAEDVGITVPATTHTHSHDE